MKRFLMFAGDNGMAADSRGPCGGWEDFHVDFDTLEKAAAYIPPSGDWLHVVDTESMDIVLTREKPSYGEPWGPAKNPGL